MMYQGRGTTRGAGLGFSNAPSDSMPSSGVKSCIRTRLCSRGGALAPLSHRDVTVVSIFAKGDGLALAFGIGCWLTPFLGKAGRPAPAIGLASVVAPTLVEEGILAPIFGMAGRPTFGKVRRK